MRTSPVRIALAAGALAAGIGAVGAAGLAQSGQSQTPGMTVYKTPT